MKKIRVLHVSTAHPASDPRIVFKQCQTLSDVYEVVCVLPRADPTLVPGIQFIAVPYFRRVIWRVLLTSPLILLRCLWLRPKLVHVYVPEFIPFAFVFWLTGAQIIYEVQENLFKKLHLKIVNRGYWLERLFGFFDRLARRYFYLIFTEHAYLDTYTDLKKPHVVIYNYPLLSFLEPFRRPYQPNTARPELFYIGLLSFERAFDTLVQSLALLKRQQLNFRIHLFGHRTFTDADLSMMPGYEDVRENLTFHGYTDQRMAFPFAAGATAGLALLKPIGDYPDSYTTKMFEYMALGLPVITSDFPLYRNVVEHNSCGFCVSPYSPEQIAEAMMFLIKHPEEAEVMGQRGRSAVEINYNWSSEAEKLLNFYQLILTE